MTVVTVPGLVLHDGIDGALRVQPHGSYELTDAEIASDVPVDDLSYFPGDVRRYNVRPNDTSAATANTAALKALIDVRINELGFTGNLYFPNFTGADIYTFDDFFQVREGIHFDLCGSTLECIKPTRVTADNGMGFFTFLRDVSFKNGYIDLYYDGTGGSGAGSIFRIGGRNGQPFGSWTTATFFESAFTKPMGNIKLSGLRLSSNNPNAAGNMILMLGGLRNVVMENLEFDGKLAAGSGIYYEFGFWSTNGFPSTSVQWSSSHASELVFRNIRVSNLRTTEVGGAGLSLIGASNALIENLRVDTANCGFVFRPGEAFFFRPGTPDFGAVKRCMTLRNCVFTGITGTGFILTGAQRNSTAYLNDTALTAAGLPVLTPSQKVDLMRFSLDGFIAAGSGGGITVSGPIDARNGTLNGSAGSGQLIISDECVRFNFTNVEIRNSTNVGVRANFADFSGANAIFPVPRLKVGVFDTCTITGNTTIGLVFTNTKSVHLRACRIGNNILYDGTTETTQTTGVSVNALSAGGGVYCDGCDVATSGGNAYSITGTVINPCGISNPKGTVTTAGNWDMDGTHSDTAANIAQDTATVNTAPYKYLYRRVWDTTNNRLMIAQGDGPTDTWKSTDGVTTVTPA